MPEQKLTYAQKLEAFRRVMQGQGLDGYIVPRTDEYQGEFIAPCAERMRYLTGFTGSAGVAVILADKAVAMSDGRYTIQIRQEVDPALYETADSIKLGAGKWLAQEAAQGSVIGFDPRLHTPGEIKKLREELDSAGISLQPLDDNLVDLVWADRPAPPAGKVEVFPVAIAGLDVAAKLDVMDESLRQAKCVAAVLTSPESVAWLLNIRGDDVACTPLAQSYAIIDALDGQASVRWYISADRLSSEVIGHIGNRVAIRAPQDLKGDLEALAAKAGERSILLDYQSAPLWFKSVLENANASLQNGRDPVILPRACKTGAEQAAIIAAHIRDGAAVVRFLHWLDTQAQIGSLNECDVIEKLESFRAADPSYRGPSFGSIAGFAANGAIIHYRPAPESCLTLQQGNLLLLDTGAQYEDGTTDVTRTIAIGKPSEEMRLHYTLVLKGHIALAMARFPVGTIGAQVDVLARRPLWNAGLDYPHGTGHGVGCYLGVHEEAASISPRGKEALRAGMLISNEPGYYREGLYGIRTENLVLVEDAEKCLGTGAAMLRFRTVTLAPMDGRLILADMLAPDEKEWLNAYHARVVEILTPLLDAKTAAWLKQAAAKI